MSADLVRCATEGIPSTGGTQECESEGESVDRGVLARLVSVDGTYPPQQLKDIAFKLGRAASSDLQINNPQVSSSHCIVECEKIGENVRVYVTDTSSNGTFVNSTKIAKGEKVELQFGDQLDLAPPAKAKTAHASFLLQRVLQPRKLDTPKPVDSEDDNENELTCCLCLEVFHQCVAALPCLHKFCAGCLSKYLKTSRGCPHCRGKITGASVDHTVKHIVDSYLSKHPDKKRPADDIKELDEADTISKGTSRPWKRSKRDYDDEEEDDDSDSDDDDDEEDDEDEDDEEDEDEDCRLCNLVRTGGAASLTSSHGTLTCTGVHVRCTQCYHDTPVCPSYPVPGACTVCHASYCDALWKSVGLTGCPHASTGGGGYLFGGFGGLFGGMPSSGPSFGMLKDFAGTPAVSSARLSAFKGNTTELQNLLTILTVNGWTTATVFTEMLAKLDAGTASYPYSAAGTASLTPLPAVTSSTYVCCRCVGPIWDDLVFQYRLSVPDDKIPATIKARPKCWYGRNCRTQTHNMSHASRYDHACVQTQF